MDSYYGALIIAFLTIFIFKIFKFCFKNLYLNLIKIYTKDFWKATSIIQILVICGLVVFVFAYGFTAFTLYDQITNRYFISYERQGEIMSYERPNVVVRQRIHFECDVKLIQNGEIVYLKIPTEQICIHIAEITKYKENKCIKILYTGGGSEYALQDCNGNELYRNYRIFDYIGRYKETAILFLIFTIITLTIKFLRDRRKYEFSE